MAKRTLNLIRFREGTVVSMQEDVERSIAFYHHLGFIVASVYKCRGQAVWAELRSG
jgi:hypothetical protein